MVWLEISQSVQQFIGMEEAFDNVNAFMDHFKEEGEQGEDDGGEEDEDKQNLFDNPEFVPSAEGHSHKLPDGVLCQVRMALIRGRYVPQWALVDRNVLIPEGCDVVKQVEHLVKETSKCPHRRLILDEAASGAFASYSMYYNIKVHLARERETSTRTRARNTAPRLGNSASWRGACCSGT